MRDGFEKGRPLNAGAKVGRASAGQPGSSVLWNTVVGGSLEKSARNNPVRRDRNMRADRSRTIRYHAGRIFRADGASKVLGNEEVCRLNKLALRDAYGDDQQCPRQEISDDSGESKKAAGNWWSGENPMGLTAFVNAYRNNPRFAAFARYYLLGHTDHDPILEIQLQTAMANMDSAAAQLGMPRAQLAAAMGFAMGNAITPDLIGLDEDDADQADDETLDLFAGEA